MNPRLQLFLAVIGWLVVFHYLLRFEWRLCGMIACVMMPLLLFCEYPEDAE